MGFEILERDGTLQPMRGLTTIPCSSRSYVSYVTIHEWLHKVKSGHTAPKTQLVVGLTSQICNLLIRSIVVPFWGLPYRILNINHKKEPLWSLWVVLSHPKSHC